MIQPLDTIAMIDLVGEEVKEEEEDTVGMMEEEKVGEVIKGAGWRWVKGQVWRLCGF